MQNVLPKLDHLCPNHDPADKSDHTTGRQTKLCSLRADTTAPAQIRNVLNEGQENQQNYG